MTFLEEMSLRNQLIMKQLLQKLYLHETLSRKEAYDILVEISQEKYNEAQLASFLTVFMMRNITVEELQGFRDALLELRRKIDIADRETIDIVGTGGDGKNTFNISTCSAFVVAGAGYQVTKHGNNSASSVSGSSNVLKHFGYEFTNDEGTLLRQLDTANICFFHAPLFHPAMKAVVPVRRALKVKTFFNMLGPLTNPAQPKYQLFGTFSLELSRLYQYILQQTEKQFTLVYALDGYDEISLTSDFIVKTHFNEKLFSPSDLGLKKCTQQSLHGGESIEDAAKIFENVLRNQATEAQKNVVLANAGMAIHCMKEEQSLVDCLAEAKESIESGNAFKCLKELVKN